MTPQNCKYAKSHEWVRIEGNLAVVGITDHAQQALGDITYAETPAVGKQLKQGASAGVVESVKAASDIYAPVSGIVAKVNSELEAAPETINADPYGKGWMYKLENFDTADLDKLLDAAAYEAFCKTEA